MPLEFVTEMSKLIFLCCLAIGSLPFIVQGEPSFLICENQFGFHETRMVFAVTYTYSSLLGHYLCIATCDISAATYLLLAGHLACQEFGSKSILSSMTCVTAIPTRSRRKDGVFMIQSPKVPACPLVI